MLTAATHQGSPLLHVYPKQFDGRWYAHHGLEVRVIGERDTRKLSMLIGIESPNNKSGDSWYGFSFPELDGSEKAPFNNYRGRLGEELGRICISEHLRRLEAEHTRGIKLNPKIPQIISFEALKNGKLNRRKGPLRMKPENKYQGVIYRKGNAETEFDGFFTYEGTHGPGVIALEAKTSRLLGLSVRSPESRKHVYKQHIEPLQTFFPDQHIDFVLMANHEYLFKEQDPRHGTQHPEAPGPYPRELRPNIRNLADFFGEHNIGFIPSTFPVNKQELNRLAKKHIDTYKRLRGMNLPTDMRHGNHWVETEDHAIVLMTGLRVKAFLERKSNRYFHASYITPGFELESYTQK